MWSSLRAELGWIRERCRRRFRCALALSLAFKALNLLLLAPLATIILRFCLTRWGRASVGNFELVSFLLSPVGIAALLGIGTILLASLYLELAGMSRLFADDRLQWWQAFQGSARLFVRVVQLGLRQLALYLALAAPFLAGIGVVYRLFWSGKDPNGLIILKPPAFWWGIGLAGAIAAAYLALALQMFCRRIYAVPILTFESCPSTAEALRRSIHRARGNFWRSASTLALWTALVSLVGAAIFSWLHAVLEAVLNASGTSLSLAMLSTAMALIVNALVATILSVAANMSFTAVVLSLYRQVAPAETLHRETPVAQKSVALSWIVGGSLAGAAALSTIGSAVAIHRQKIDEVVEITAHRAGATGAPENTIAALKQAIINRADWAEFDVQLTLDKAIVVLHDIDLARVGGGSRRVDEATFAEIRDLRAWSTTGQQFASEKIPTLKEFLLSAGDKILLNVELKPHNTRDANELTRRVIEEIRNFNMVARCRICSQSYESLQLARHLEPRLPVGYIAATSIGDLTRLQVDFLMVKSVSAHHSQVQRLEARLAWSRRRRVRRVVLASAR